MTILKSQATGIIEIETSEIATLEGEIVKRNEDIQLLREAIATLEAKRIRPIDPKADSAFALLVEMVGAAPENLEQQQIYLAKIQAAKLSLKLAVELYEQKQVQLKALKDEARSHEASQLLQQLSKKAQEYNSAIDASFELLVEMKMLNSEITRLRGERISILEIVADLNEVPYFQVGNGRVFLRRRFDVRRN